MIQISVFILIWVLRNIEVNSIFINYKKTFESMSEKVELRFHKKNNMDVFIVFSAINRRAICSKNPTKKAFEITQILSSIWKNLPPKSKQYYIDLTQKLNQKQAEDYKNYLNKRKKYVFKKSNEHKNEKENKRETDKDSVNKMLIDVNKDINTQEIEDIIVNSGEFERMFEI